MSEEQEVQTGGLGYGYETDEVKVSNLSFGLNENTKMTKFQYIPNGGKDGAEQDALDIVFNINGTDKSYRMFPITKVYVKGEPVEDQSHPAFVDAFRDFNARIIHILHAFVEDKKIRQALARKTSDFKSYISALASVLPPDFAEKDLHIFLQYQWQPSSGQTKTYLEIPTKMKQGPWLTPAIPGKWEERRAEKFNDKTTKALWYVNVDGTPDEKGNLPEHLFTKNGWFLSNPYGIQQGSSSVNTTSSGSSLSAATAEMNASNIGTDQGVDQQTGW